MKKTLLILFVFITFTNIYGQQAYYNDVDLTLSGMALKDALATKITNTHTNILSYTDAREALKIIDLIPGQGTNVYLIYGFASQICPSSPSNSDEHRRRNKADFGGGSCEWNREHTYPKSLGTPELGTSGPGADAHMLRACDTQRNSQRGNKLFRDGSGNSHIVNSSFWYPGDEWKGDIARMMMYMYLRYDSQCLPTNVGFGSTTTIDPDMVTLFLDWNAEDPVSEYERNRNEYLAIASNNYGQGNRNPFIDEPYLATRIWGGPDAEDTWGIYMGVDAIEQNIQVILYPNPASDTLYLSHDADIQIENVTLYALTGDVIEVISYNTDKISLKQIPDGIYFVKIKSTQGTITRKLVVNKKK